jgi:septal ring factor EnvC (AmiA/AmiB activator)
MRRSLLLALLFATAFAGCNGSAEARKEEQDKARVREEPFRREIDQGKARVEALARELGELQAVVGFAGGGEDGVEGKAVAYPARVRSQLEGMNKDLPAPLPGDQLTCEQLLAEWRRAHAVLKTRAEELRLVAENRESALEEEKNTRRRVEQLKNEEIERLVADHKKAQDRLEQNLQQYERQVTDLRERIKNLVARCEEQTAKVAQMEKELQELKGKQGKK